MDTSSSSIQNQWRITVPTLFTLARIFLTPIIVYSMVQQYWQQAFYLFLIAAISDVIDGALARHFNAKTFLGGCLDALADKFLLLSCFGTLAFIQTPHFIVPRWFVIIALLKECILIIGSYTIFKTTGSIEIQPTFLGKATTFFQICFIIWFFFCYFFHWFPIKTYGLVLGLVLLLLVASLVQYMYIGFCFIKKKGTAYE